MAVQKRPNRINSWRVSWREPGTGRVRREDFSGPDAEKKARIRDAEIKFLIKKNPALILDTKENPDITLNALITMYLNDTKQYKNKTSIKNELYHLSCIGKVIGQVRVGSLEKHDLYLLKKDHQERGLSAGTFKRRWEIIRAALNWGVDEGIIETNPVSGYRVKKPQQQPIQPPTQRELNALLAVAPPHLARIILLAYYTGGRPGPSELFSLSWKTVDLKKGWIEMLSANKGNRVWRDIPMHPTLRRNMIQWKKEDIQNKIDIPLVIHYGNKPVQSVKRAWGSAKTAAGITRRLRLYDIRHAFVSDSLDAGADIKAVSLMVGHADIDTTMKHYQHIKNSLKETAIGVLPGLDVIQQGGTKRGNKPAQNPRKTVRAEK